MPLDETFAARVRKALGRRKGVVEKKMFGGLAFLVNGNMSVGVHGSELIVRVALAESEAALKQPGVRLFDITGRPMKGWLMVSDRALKTDRSLASWIERGVTFARSLPPK